ncbi:thiol reductase thioredoxin [Marivirga tractuosa]|uniref:Thioredoxin n=1 Tax=Marivirga tractuosa (strain ATCC 23168 / DSM 4126 / NBRC 15989 / NCIMB 1408 / VKM B-1430 / H-43) TaxID=643867 RepID=E4TQ14_MARTH|nr:thioredoxin family protein [Marivirga tractuosa]ADR20571.1 Thioredoxin domain-containing protein [Marivirga tractuosa DSM 4126]BDD14981.1 thiol reductase thioredoxin [Marivirga tractuosa]
MIETVTDINLEETLMKNEKVVVKFFADWCGVCKAFAPQFKKMAEEADENIKFLEINAPDNPKARLSAGVYSLPFFASYENGELKEKISSSDRKAVQQLIDGFKNKEAAN